MKMTPVRISSCTKKTSPYLSDWLPWIARDWFIVLIRRSTVPWSRQLFSRHQSKIGRVLQYNAFSFQEKWERQETRRRLRWHHIWRSQRWTLLIVLSDLERYLPLPQGRLVLQIFLQCQRNPVYKSKYIGHFFSNLIQRHIIFDLLIYGLILIKMQNISEKKSTEFILGAF